MVGSVGNEQWRHSTYGTKIMKAVELREAGASIAIVGEDHWRGCCLVEAGLGKAARCRGRKDVGGLMASSRASSHSFQGGRRKSEHPETTKPPHFCEGFVLYGAAPGIELVYNPIIVILISVLIAALYL
jgi:hypothetical protein